MALWHALAAAAVLLAPAALASSIVPVRAIRAQTVLSASDLVVGETEVPGAIAAIEAAVGLEARVTLYPGRAILPSQLGPPAIVARNQVVRMEFRSGALAITAEGRALDRAGPGEMVRVMNLGSKQVVTGTVSASGTIEVGK